MKPKKKVLCYYPGETSKNEYPLTEGDNLPAAVKTYEYKYDKTADGGTGWNDKLVKIIATENGTPTTYDMSYDAIGNLTSYNGYSYTWEGRQLRTITGNEKNISFKYNSSGIRTEKAIDGKVTKYHLVGDRVTYEETKDSSGNVMNKIDINGYDLIALAGLGFIYAIPGVGEIAVGVTLFAVGTYGVYKAGVWIENRIRLATGKKRADKANKAKASASPSILQNEVEKGQVPKDIDRVDKFHVQRQKPHVYFKDGTFLNNDGTIHDAHKGTPNPSNKTKEWLKKNEWKVGR